MIILDINNESNQRMLTLRYFIFMSRILKIVWNMTSEMEVLKYTNLKSEIFYISIENTKLHFFSLDVKNFCI